MMSSVHKLQVQPAPCADAPDAPDAAWALYKTALFPQMLKMHQAWISVLELRNILRDLHHQQKAAKFGKLSNPVTLTSNALISDQHS